MTMDNFKKKFVEEAFDLLNELEKVLIQLESTTEKQGVFEHIFRIMHTLKGNSAMFGFTLIDQYTHQLETIYDLIRNGKMEVSEDLMDLTLSSVDHIRNLLDEDSSMRPDVQATHKMLLARIGSVIEKKDKPVPETITKESAADTESTYYILFQPLPTIMKDGTNPLFLVEDFKTLGEYIPLPCFNLPEFEELEAEKCYTSWEIILSTKESTEKIHEIFIFAEDSCHLEIQKLCDKNLLADPAFCSRVREAGKNNDRIGLEKIIELTVNEQSDSKNNKDKNLQPNNINDITSRMKNISSIRVSSEKLDELINLVSELVTTQAGLSLIAEKIKSKDLLSLAEDVEKLSRRLRDSTFGIRLIPIENMITRFQRLVRELSHELKKNIAFQTEGTEIELDKNMIEGLIDPIMHIIRNSIDHGIESPDARKKAGKSDQGVISFKAYHSGSNVYIQVSDDGAGIDLKNIRNNAIKKGLIQPETVLPDKDLLDMIFLPGFTTAKNITNISGRGVGMDVVKNKIADLRGEVSIETKLHVGTTITLKLPLTLSIIDGLLVEINKAFFVIPLSSVNKCFEFKHEVLLNAVNNLIYVNDGHIPFIYLRNEFGITTEPPDLEQVVVIEFGDTRIGLTVDKVIGEYQAVLKSLGIIFKKQDIISGATILGDGTVALVLDPNKIINQFSYQNQKAMK
jgi:two-component system chemotaxis sensor kinase CheA